MAGPVIVWHCVPEAGVSPCTNWVPIAYTARIVFSAAHEDADAHGDTHTHAHTHTHDVHDK